jgi:hypothetical protein
MEINDSHFAIEIGITDLELSVNILGNVLQRVIMQEKEAKY